MYEIHLSIPKDTLPIKLRCKNNYKIILPVLPVFAHQQNKKNPPHLPAVENF